MSYGRAKSDESLDIDAIRALVKMLGLDVSEAELKALAAGYSNQLAAKKSIERFPLQNIVPILNMNACWSERA